MGATGNGSVMVESVKILSNRKVVIRMKLMAIISFRMRSGMGGTPVGVRRVGLLVKASGSRWKRAI